MSAASPRSSAGDVAHRPGRVHERAPGRSRRPRGADHAGAGPARARRRRRRGIRRSRARAQLGVPAAETAPPARPCQAAPGRCRRARSTRPRTAAARPSRPMPRGSAAARSTALGDDRAAAAAFDHALALAPQRQPTSGPTSPASAAPVGDIAGALEAVDRAVAAKSAQRRGAGAARRADPRPIWPRRFPALVRPGARGRFRQCRRPARARHHLWRPRPDERHARRRPPRSIGLDRRPSDRLLSPGDARRPRRAISSSPDRFTTGPAARSTTRPAGMLLSGAIDFETGNAEQAVAAPRSAGRDAARQPQGAPAARRRPVADGRRRAARSRRFGRSSIGRTPTATACRLIGRALDAAGRSAPRPRSISPAPPGRSRRRAHRARSARATANSRACAEPPRERPGDGPDPGSADLAPCSAAARATRRSAARARLQAANPGAPDVHMLAGDALGMTRRFRRRRRALSPRRQPRLHRGGGACA